MGAIFAMRLLCAFILTACVVAIGPPKLGGRRRRLAFWILCVPFPILAIVGGTMLARLMR